MNTLSHVPAEAKGCRLSCAVRTLYRVGILLIIVCVLLLLQTPERRVFPAAIVQSVLFGEVRNWRWTVSNDGVAVISLLILFLSFRCFFVRGIATSGLK